MSVHSGVAATTTPGPTNENPRADVDAVLQAFLREQRTSLLAVSPHLAPVLDLAESYLDGGKRMRPAFCYWGWRATGAAPTDGLIAAAASLELLQACALIHDDVMDSSDTRRGRPSAHRQFETQHRANDWHGDPAAFGLGAAILLGDLFLTWSDQLFTTSGLPADAVARARPRFDTMRSELMAGQYLDLVVQAQAGTDRAAIATVLRYKTAKYTIEYPLQIGALLADADDDLVSGLGAFGLPLGEAFQLRDDLLGAFGDPEVTGKPAGDDLREGKRTLLVAEAMERASAADAATLQAGLGNPELDEAGVAALRAVLASGGATEAVEQQIEERLSASLAALDRLQLPPQAAQPLHAMAAAAVHRVR